MRTTKIPPTPPPAGCRPVVYAISGKHGESYKVECKGPGYRKTLGTLATRDACFAAFATFVATGELPEPAKRGPKGPHGKSRPPSPLDRKPKPKAPPLDRKAPPPPPVDPGKAARLEMLKRLAAAYH